MSSGPAIEPFTIHVDDEVLGDLRARLGQTRFPDQLDGTGWEYGIPTDLVRDLVGYWRDGYDWRAEEARLNALPHCTTTIDGQRIHFVHQRSTNERAVPVVMTHGWPGSIAEFLEVIPQLAEPGAGADATAFHVVAPSLPGYGFSGPTRDCGWDPTRIARAFAELMHALGYDRYIAQGGDWGAQVSTRLAAIDAEHCVGLHLNMPLAGKPKEDVALDDVAQRDLAAFAEFQRDESAYALLQRTKPQTVGVALNDSPAGLLAWIVEKFQRWSDCDGDVERAFTRDQLITNVMIYWVTGTITSAMRLYWEARHSGEVPEYVAVPTGIARYPKEPLRLPRAWVERTYNVVRWETMPHGGHFAAMEQPDLFADDLRAFAAELARVDAAP
jgi:microsomal epoxide hydrolase